MNSYSICHLENYTEKNNQLVLCRSLADAAVKMANERYVNIQQ